MIHINRYIGKLPIEVEQEIIELAVDCNIGEPYDTECDLVFTWVQDDEIVAVIAFYLQLFSNGKEIPRWEHIFYHPRVRTTKNAYHFIKDVVNTVAMMYDQIWAFVKPEKDYMRKYALRFGFEEYSSDREGKYLVLNFNKQHERKES